MIISIIKVLVVLIGFVSTIWFSISGLRGNKNGYKKAGFSLILTFLLVSIMSIIEQRMYSDKLKDQKDTVISK